MRFKSVKDSWFGNEYLPRVMTRNESAVFKEESVDFTYIEDLFLRPAVSVLLLFATLPECSQNQTAVSDTLRLFSDF